MKKIIAILCLALILVGCGQKKDENTVKIGIVGTDSVVWKHVAEKVKVEGVNLELVFFDSYTLPNAALEKGEIDLNAFQHKAFLDKEIEESGYKIESIGQTNFAPLGIYSSKLKSVNEIADGGKVAIPDDPSNGGRALLLLQQAGLIKVDEKAGLSPTVKDIKENKKNLEIVELAAANIPPVMEEIPLAVINSGIAVDSGIKPTDALVIESKDYNGLENPFINLIAARVADKDKENIKKVLDAYYSKDTREVILEDSKGAYFPVWEAK